MTITWNNTKIVDFAAQFPGWTAGATPYVLEQVINAAWNKGLEQATKFEDRMTTADTWLDPSAAPTMSASTSALPSVVEPGVNIPAQADVDAFDLFDSKYAELVTTLAGYYTNFITTYFPDDSATYAQTEAWLQDGLSNPDRVLPQTLADVIWEEDRTRILADAVRATDEIVASWAAKGYPLPPGAAVAAVAAVQRQGQEELAKSSRSVAVKTFELAYDKIKFVVGTAVEARKNALAAAGQYITAIASAPDVASKMINVGYDAQSKLISAAAQFYNARTAAAELTFKANSFNASQGQDAAKTNVQSELALVAERLKALLAEADTIGRQSIALLNNVNVSTAMSSSASSNYNENKQV